MTPTNPTYSMVSLLSRQTILATAKVKNRSPKASHPWSKSMPWGIMIEKYPREWSCLFYGLVCRRCYPKFGMWIHRRKRTKESMAPLADQSNPEGSATDSLVGLLWDLRVWWHWAPTIPGQISKASKPRATKDNCKNKRLIRLCTWSSWWLFLPRGL